MVCLQEPVIQFSHVSMEFPGVLANDDVSLTVHKGEIFCPGGGERGGKEYTHEHSLRHSHANGGSLTVKGQEIAHFSPKAAIELGVGMVHQHFMLVPSFTVAQNIVLGREPRRAGLSVTGPPPESRSGAVSGVWPAGGSGGQGVESSASACSSGWRF